MPVFMNHFSATTKSIVEKAVERGVLTYPGICYISDTNTLAWMTMDNEIRYITGDDQITDIKYVGSDIVFYSGDRILFSYNASLSPESEKAIIEKITNDISLDEYIKAVDVSHLLDDIIGDLEDKSTVVDYIHSLSYDSLADIPIVNLTGSLTNAVDISAQSDGVYRIKGPFIIGGNQTTVQSAANDTFFIVSHGDSGIQITQLQGKSIKIYFINPDGTYTTDRYLTEKWIAEQDFITSANVREYVRDIVADTISQIIDETLDERLDAALDKKISGISSDDIKQIFSGGRN